MANKLTFANPVTFSSPVTMAGGAIFTGGIPLSIPVASSDPGSPAEGDVYYNITDNQLKVYTSGAWQLLYTSGQPLALFVTNTDPVGASNGDLYYNSVSNQVKVYAAGVWTALSTGSSASYNVDKFTLNGTDITNKYVTLSGTPTSPSDTILSVSGGIEQDYSDDFVMIGNQLSWDSLGLDGVLVAGDKLTVQFD